MKKVASIFGGGQTGAQKASAAAAAQAQQDTKDMVAKQESAAAAEKKDLQVKQNATLNSSRKRKAGYRSLIFGDETGTDKRDTLG